MKKKSLNEPPTQEFRVTIKGIRIPAEAVRRINRAVQKAVVPRQKSEFTENIELAIYLSLSKIPSNPG